MPRIAVGDRFPPVALPDLDGTLRPLTRHWADGPALVAIGHAECGTTRLALPFVDRVRRRGGRVVTVLQEDAAGARALLDELRLETPVVLDLDPFLFGEQLGIETVPTLVRVEPSGVVAAVVEGFDRDALEALAAALGVTTPLMLPEDEAPRLRPG